MLDVRDVSAPAPLRLREPDFRAAECTAAESTLEALVCGLPLQRRRLRPKQYVFRAGQPRHALHLIHAGFFKTSVISADGREKITGFRLRGELLGLDALDMSTLRLRRDRPGCRRSVGTARARSCAKPFPNSRNC